MTTRWETSSNSEGEWDVCEEGGGDMITDLKGNPNGERDAKSIVRDHNEAEALREALTLVLEDMPRFPMLQSTANKVRAALRGSHKEE